MRFLICYGPTREPIDPVRYISNYSTGTMGRALVEEAQKKNHAVTTVECPKDAETAKELLAKLKKLAPKYDVLVMAAAVCDSRPASFSNVKIKKDRLSSIKLVQNPDILAELSKKKAKSQIFAGFALESASLKENGQQKLRRKGLDLIVVQKADKKQSPFGTTEVDFLILSKDRAAESTGKISKQRLAAILTAKCESYFKRA